MTCEDVSKDTPRLAHEETDPICVAELVDLETHLDWSVYQHNHLKLLEHLREGGLSNRQFGIQRRLSRAKKEDEWALAEARCTTESKEVVLRVCQAKAKSHA